MRRGFRPVAHLFLLRFFRFPLPGLRLERFLFCFTRIPNVMIVAISARKLTHFIISSTCSPPFYTFIIRLSVLDCKRF